MNAPTANLSIMEIGIETQRLTNLRAVYDIRLARVEREVAAALGEGAELDQLLGLLSKDLSRVDEQRRLWTRRWQEWLERGGAVQHGRSFTQRHAEFGELERVLLQHQSEIGQQRKQAQQRIDAARAERNHLSRQRDALLEKCGQLRRTLEGRREVQQDEQSGELSLTRWYGLRAGGELALEGLLP